MSGKRAFLELLKQEGVEIVFGNPGTTELPLMDAFAAETEIKYILGLQEAALMGPTRVGPRLRGDRAEIAKAAAILAAAKRPVIMAGDAVAQSRALAELVELAELIGAPVYAEFVPNTASFPASHPLFRGHVIRLQSAVRKVLDEYDVLVSAGADLFTLSLPSNVDPMPPGMPLIHLDTDPWEIGKNYPGNAAILGDPKSTLPELSAMVAERMPHAGRGAERARLQTASETSLPDRHAR